MSTDANQLDPAPQYQRGYVDGYAMALQDVRATVENLAAATLDGDEVTAPVGEETAAELISAAAEPVDEPIRVGPEEVAQPDPATDSQKQRNRERAARIGRPGIYSSMLALTIPPKEDPIEVVLVGDEADGWWFFLTDDYPAAEWRADIRWFPKVGATFIESTSAPMQPGDIGDDGDFDDHG